MVNTFSQVLDDLYTTSWQKRLQGVFDNIFAATPFWFWLKDKGKLRSEHGGRFIEINLEYGQNSTVQWISRGGTVDLSDFRFLTVGQYQWRYLVANIMRYGIDEQQNSGDAQIINWVNAKLNNTEESLITELESRLVGGSGAAVSPAPAFDGLQFLVPDAGNVALSAFNAGGIDPSVYTWWQSQAIDMNGQSFGVYGLPNMRHLLNQCMNNRAMDQPDIIVSDMNTYEQYEDLVLPTLRLQNTRLADVGFVNQTFKAIPMVWTPSMTQRMYFLNTRFLEFIYDPMYFFDMTEWKAIPNQPNDKAAQVELACSFTTSRRRTQGVLSTINTN